MAGTVSLMGNQWTSSSCAICRGSAIIQQDVLRRKPDGWIEKLRAGDPCVCPIVLHRETCDSPECVRPATHARPELKLKLCEYCDHDLGPPK